MVRHAFHWFNGRKVRAEFRRILRPGGCMVLLWNELRRDTSPFMDAYEDLIRTHKTEGYEEFDREESIRAFFDPEPFRRHVFHHAQPLDLDGLKGRLLSSSYVLDKGQPEHHAMMRELQGAFEAHQEGGQIAFEYETLVYYGSPS